MGKKERQQTGVAFRVLCGLFLIGAGIFAIFNIARTFAQKIYFLVYIALVLYFTIYWVKKAKKPDKKK